MVHESGSVSAAREARAHESALGKFLDAVRRDTSVEEELDALGARWEGNLGGGAEFGEGGRRSHGIGSVDDQGGKLAGRRRWIGKYDEEVVAEDEISERRSRERGCRLLERVGSGCGGGNC